MRLTTLSFLASFLVLTLVVSAHLQAQPTHPRQSPIDISRTFIGDTYIKVVYGKPYKRDREIFGELVPHGAVWRTGANEATEIVFSEDIIFGDEPVSAGIYSLFAIPNEDNWTLILNNQLGAWGAFRYDQSRDVVRVSVPVTKLAEIQEDFDIRFETQENATQTTMHLAWDTVSVSVTIKKP